MKIFRPFKRLLRVATRSVEEERGYVVLPYRGYGSAEEIFMIGRVFHQPTSKKKRRTETGNLLTQIGRRLLRTGVPDVELEVRFQAQRTRVATDDDGYFRVHLHLDERPPAERLWHEIEIDLVDPETSDEPVQGPETRGETVKGQIFVPPDAARHVTISDIDDTVIYTGVANKVKMFWRLFVEDAESRVAFPGISALYQGFLRGTSGAESNPILYVSRGPWGIYDMLDEFFDEHDIPIGPILFLREWNVRWRSPLPRKAKDHKRDLIRKMLALYDELPFVLIGDSGQHDPEVYADIIRDHPGRVEAVYIREVTRSRARKAEISRLAEEVEKAGASLVLADDSYAMARHAHEHGFISSDALERVLEERTSESTPKERAQRRPLVVDGQPAGAAGRGKRSSSGMARSPS